MDSQSNIYCQDIPARPEQIRQTLLLVLLAKFAVVLLLGCAYFCVRMFG
jgi:hypothetical protein